MPIKHCSDNTAREAKACAANVDDGSVGDLFPDKGVLIKILNHAFGDIIVTDAKGKLIFFNDAVPVIFGLTPEELLKVNIYDFERLHLADRYPAGATALDKKEQVIKFMKNKDLARVVAATPIFGEDGGLEMAVIYSLPEELLDRFSKSVKGQRDLAEIAIRFLVDSSNNAGTVISKNQKMCDIYNFALRASSADSTITLYGESGTGKEVFAHYIHRNSSRKDGKFIPVNCAAIPQELVESELFGYEGGAFTGAKSSGKPGLFEIANHGTIFMDEIGELPLLTQAKLLRVLETGDIIRIGGNKVHHTDVRIITATNRDLFEMTKNGSFRTDLYYRLNILPISIPPLRERTEDIIALSNHFIELNNKKYHGEKTLSARTARLFMEYSWPGNVRELKNIIERLYIISHENELNIEEEMLFGPKVAVKTPPGASPLDYGSDYASAVEEFGRKYIHAVVQQCQGNITLAAKKLGLHRSSVYKKLGDDTGR